MIVQIYQYAVLTVDDRVVKAGSLTEARCISIADNAISDETVRVAAATAVKLWDKDEVPGNADFIWIESDLDLWIQFTTSAGVSDNYDIKKLAGSGTAGRMGPALVLGSDDTLKLDGAIDVFTGTAGTIDEIWVKNESTTDAARVRIIVAT